MKQKIYEIPVWDAFKSENCECPVCTIEKKCEDDFIDALFTEMVMDVRLNPQLVEDYDFCHDHFEKLYKYPDKFGLAILTNRILYTKRKNLKEFNISDSNSKGLFVKGLFRKKTLTPSGNNNKECLLCRKLSKDMDNYIETLLNLWSKDIEFRKLYKNSRGFCIPHYNTLLKFANYVLKDHMADDFKTASERLQEANLERLQEELEWFISKFDYRFADEPWKTSKDALIRTLQKLIGNYNNNL